MKVFRSKTGYELLIPITLIFIVIFSLPILDEAPIGAILTISALLIVIYAFILYVFLGTTYTITSNDQLIVKCGFTKYAPIDIQAIKIITKTNNLISSPAPSLDRIEVFYNKYSSVIISPKDKTGLIEALKQINPGISYHPN